jgi:hypothetical protein
VLLLLATLVFAAAIGPCVRGRARSKFRKRSRTSVIMKNGVELDVLPCGSKNIDRLSCSCPPDFLRAIFNLVTTVFIRLVNTLNVYS